MTPDAASLPQRIQRKQTMLQAYDECRADVHALDKKLSRAMDRIDELTVAVELLGIEKANR